MRNAIYCISMVMLMGMVMSCHKEKAAEYKNINGNKVLVCDLSKVKDTLTLKLSDLIENLDLVKLETTQDALVKRSVTIVSDNYIGIRNYGELPFKLFDISGKFLRCIGKKGRGPNEYGPLYSEQIDEKNKRIYLMPWVRNTLWAYDFEGNYLPPVELKYKQTKSRVFVEGDKVTVLGMPFAKSPAIAFSQKIGGEIINEVKPKKCQIQRNFNSELFSYRNTKAYDLYLFNFDNPTTDSLYHYENGKLIPKFTAEYGGDKVPMHIFSELPNYFCVNVLKQIKKGKNRLAIGKGNIFINKETCEANYVKIENDFLGGIPASMSFRDGMYIANIPAIGLKESIKKVLESGNTLKPEIEEKLKKLDSEIDIEDNNIIMYGKLKV